MHANHNGPGEEQRAGPVWCWEIRGQLSPNVSQFFQNITYFVAGSKAGSGIKGMTRPTCGEVLVRHQADSTKRSSMIGTFISKIHCVCVHMLQGNT